MKKIYNVNTNQNKAEEATLVLGTAHFKWKFNSPGRQNDP